MVIEIAAADDFRVENRAQAKVKGQKHYDQSGDDEGPHQFRGVSVQQSC